MGKFAIRTLVVSLISLVLVLPTYSGQQFETPSGPVFYRLLVINSPGAVLKVMGVELAPCKEIDYFATAELGGGEKLVIFKSGVQPSTENVDPALSEIFTISMALRKNVFIEKTDESLATPLVNKKMIAPGLFEYKLKMSPAQKSDFLTCVWGGLVTQIENGRKS